MVPMSPTSLTGDGLVLAAELGAVIHRVPDSLSIMLGYTVPGADGKPPTSCRAGIVELLSPHTLLVNRRGRRFADESFFQGIVPRLLDFDVPTHAPANRPCYLIFDAQFARRYGFAGRPPGQPIPPWMPCADTARALAERLGIDPAGLEATLAAFNAGAREGVDAAFGRGQSAWARRSAGDASHQQNPNLGPVEDAPFYGVELVPSPSVSGGLTADPDARIIHVRGHAIPGLYGAGNTCAVTEYGVGYQAGLTLTSSLTFGTLAVEHALGQSQ
jgi:3-oxosteroid 1-dehydrogenase